ncbi:MAG TPA: hypothetical protein V6C64_08355 [Microcoleaceae cyanobacterium]
MTAPDGIEAISLYIQHQSQIGAVVVNLLIAEPDVSTTIRALKRINPQLAVVAVYESTFDPQPEDDVRAMIQTYLKKHAQPLKAKCERHIRPIA